jgi:hypothetical protein
MLSDAAGALARNAPQTHVAETADSPAQAVDVSHVAQSVLFYGHIVMEAEAFGMAVTRRPGADGTDLTPYERTRLLDVLCHAQCFRQKSEFSECTFAVWLVSSDARDSRARTHWFAMKRDDSTGIYLVRLSDL